MKAQDVQRGSVITFKTRIDNNLDYGTKWRVTIPAATDGAKGNMLMVKLGKKGQPLSYINNTSNLQSLTENEFAKLIEKEYITVEA